MKTIYKFIFWLGYSALLLQACIPIGGSLNTHEIGHTVRLDYFLHFLAFMLIVLYFFLGRHFKLHLFETRPITKFYISIASMAVFTELIQLFIPDRAFNVWDLAANAVGIAVGFGFTFLMKSNQRSRG